MTLTEVETRLYAIMGHAYGVNSNVRWTSLYKALAQFHQEVKTANDDANDLDVAEEVRGWIAQGQQRQPSREGGSMKEIKSDVIQAIHKSLREFGYITLTEEDVKAKAALIRYGGKLSIIGMFAKNIGRPITEADVKQVWLAVAEARRQAEKGAV